MRFYHGTLWRSVPSILKHGLRTSVGWGGANTEGVFLASAPAIALYWAKYAWTSRYGVDFEDFPADKEGSLAVLVVNIPKECLCHLHGDVEQYEEYNLPENTDWRTSLKVTGSVRFDRKIPPEWIKREAV